MVNRDRALPAFSVAFAVLYLLATYFNLALVTYHPAFGQLEFLARPPKVAGSPTMYWYGWIMTAAIGASVVGVIAPFVPLRWTQWMSPALSAVIPLCVMLIFVYLLRGWFIPSVALILR